ncbi:MAG TPA: DUF4178 domain-containing protein [Bdellovibrionales bacterium]|nr:DUF4178 domain-containing protein [Bdellovibrionales bacterium]
MSRKTYNCPACGAQLVFQSAVSVFAVCSYCQSMVVRHDVDLENLGKMAQLPPDMSPLQIGTTGRFENRSFVLAGRLKLQWESGTWTEWFALFNDGSQGWLADAQGLLMMSFESELAQAPELSKISVGTPIATKRGTLTVKDIKNATCVGSQGELPFKAPHGRKSTTADLEGANDDLFGTLDYGPEGVKLYTGRYGDFEDFQFQNLREIDGW